MLNTIGQSQWGTVATPRTAHCTFVCLYHCTVKLEKVKAWSLSVPSVPLLLWHTIWVPAPAAPKLPQWSPLFSVPQSVLCDCLSLPQHPMASHSLLPGTSSLVFKTSRLWLSTLTILLTPVHFINFKNSWHLFPVQRRELAHLVALDIYIDGSQIDILG